MPLSSFGTDARPIGGQWTRCLSQCNSQAHNAGSGSTFACNAARATCLQVSDINSRAQHALASSPGEMCQIAPRCAHHSSLQLRQTVLAAASRRPAIPNTAEANGASKTDDTSATMPTSIWDVDEPDYAALREACEAGLPDVEACSLDLIEPKTRSQDTIANSAKAVLERTLESSVLQEAWSRGKWLLGLLVLQSSSSMILNEYEGLIKEHLIVTLFLTMLVGAGGNAGNQSAIKIIRGLATGKIQPTAMSVRRSMVQQAQVGLILASALSLGGFVRVYITNGDVLNAVAISAALFAIVLCSVFIGSGLPFALQRVGLDPANAGTSVQVIMDVLGVAITCVTCHFVLDIMSKSLGYT